MARAWGKTFQQRLARIRRMPQADRLAHLEALNGHAGTRYYDPTVHVPEEWAEYAFEYRHGHSWGTHGHRIPNPVWSDPVARAAWAEGRRVGREERRSREMDEERRRQWLRQQRRKARSK